jgi:hypothetical protein
MHFLPSGAGPSPCNFYNFQHRVTISSNTSRYHNNRHSLANYHSFTLTGTYTYTITMPYSSPTRSEINTQTFLDALEPIECIICHEEYSEAHQPVTLPECRHVFGLPCLRTWIRSPNRGHNRCPSCRALLFDDGLVPVDNGGAVPQQLAGRLMALAQSRSTFSTWLREAQQELDRLESRYPSRPRGTHNEPHDSQLPTDGSGNWLEAFEMMDWSWKKFHYLALIKVSIYPVN